LAAEQSPAKVIALVLRAWRAALFRLPAMWRRRRAIRAAAKIDPRELAALLRAHRVSLRELAFKD